MTRFGQVLRAERERVGISQSAVARRAGVSSSAISRIEAGRRAPERTTVSACVAALDLDPAGSRARRLFSAAGYQLDDDDDDLIRPVLPVVRRINNLLVGGVLSDARRTALIAALDGLITLASTGSNALQLGYVVREDRS